MNHQPSSIKFQPFYSLLKGTLVCSLLALLPSSVSAQSDYVADDAGQTTGAVWTEIGATKVLPYDLSLGFDAGFRHNASTNEADRVDVGISLGWKPGKHWKFGVGYTLLMKFYPTETAHKSEQELEYKYRKTGDSENTDFASFMGEPTYTADDGTIYRYRGYNDAQKDFTRVTGSYWRPKHRLSLDAAYSYKLWKMLRISLRERYQLTLLPSKDISRTRDRVKTVTKYRGINRDENGNIKYYDDVVKYWQEGDIIYGQELLYKSNTGTYDPQTATDVTAAYLADHNNEYLNTTEEVMKEKSSKTLHTLRSRLTLEIDKKGWLVTPYIYGELFNDLGDGFHTDKVRLSAGIEYSPASLHKVSFGYIFNHENDDDGNQNVHALSVGYRFKF